MKNKSFKHSIQTPSLNWRSQMYRRQVRCIEEVYLSLALLLPHIFGGCTNCHFDGHVLNLLYSYFPPKIQLVCLEMDFLFLLRLRGLILLYFDRKKCLSSCSLDLLV